MFGRDHDVACCNFRSVEPLLVNIHPLQHVSKLTVPYKATAVHNPICLIFVCYDGPNCIPSVLKETILQHVVGCGLGDVNLEGQGHTHSCGNGMAQPSPSRKVQRQNSYSDSHYLVESSGS